MVERWQGVELSVAFSGRTRSEHQEYRRVRREEPDRVCPFCRPDPDYLVSSSTHTHLLLNRFPYAIWENQVVEEHLMLVPRTHHESMSSMSAEEYADMVAMLREYEPNGYSIYTRGATNQGRSQVHLHTHLIRTSTTIAPAVITTIEQMAQPSRRTAVVATLSA